MQLNIVAPGSCWQALFADLSHGSAFLGSFIDALTDGHVNTPLLESSSDALAVAVLHPAHSLIQLQRPLHFPPP